MYKRSICFFIFLILFNTLSYAKAPTTLSLQEAIMLAVRTNPNVQQSQLNYVLQKFNLWVQQWQFYPHYSFQVDTVYTRNGTSGQLTGQSVSVQPGASLLTPIGTQFTLNSTNTQNGDHFIPQLSLAVSQPLMRGFGKAVVEAALENARDTEMISRLAIEGTLRTTITTVINAYLDVMTAEQNIVIDEKALTRAQESVEQTKLFIKAGHKAGNELITVQADVASAQTKLANDKNLLKQTQYALLTAIGIDPNATINFDHLNLEELNKKYHLTTLDDAKKLILENDIQYQTDQITLNGSTSRNLLVAEDNARWQLNLTANATAGNNSAGNLFSNESQSQSIGLTLQIPIDDQQAKQAVLSAKIALKEAKLALKQEKWAKETSAINGWNSVISADQALRFAGDAEKLQEKTYYISYQKYLHGLIDSLELQSAQTQLIQAQQVLLNAQVNYIKSLVNMDLLIGNTLKTWNLKVRV